MPLTVSLGICESSLNGGTEYDSFKECVGVLTISLLANARAGRNILCTFLQWKVICCQDLCLTCKERSFIEI
jgi:hypothetical protein